MSPRESELYEAGMSVPPSLRRQVAPRLFKSVEPDEAEAAAEIWLHTEAAGAYDALKSDPSRVIPAENLRARFEVKWVARS